MNKSKKYNLIILVFVLLGIVLITLGLYTESKNKKIDTSSNEKMDTTNKSDLKTNSENENDNKDNNNNNDDDSDSDTQITPVTKIDDTKDWVYDAEYQKNVKADSYATPFHTYYAKDIVVPYININST